MSADVRVFAGELLALCDVADRIADGKLPVVAVREIACRMVDMPGPSLIDAAHRFTQNKESQQ